jgi:hypothetical protein
MAETVLVVCDVCGAAPAETVGISARGRNYQKDLCAMHGAELLKGARAPRRGRPRKPVTANATAAPKRRGRSPKSTTAAPAASRPDAASADKASASETRPAAKRPRKKITDPAILQKRRDALAKARQALAAKRASAANAG